MVDEAGILRRYGKPDQFEVDPPVELEKTSCATGKLRASNRMMNGTAPVGMNARARLTYPDDFAHRLTHVGVEVKHELHERDALYVFRVEVLDAGDMEEVELVVLY